MKNVSWGHAIGVSILFLLIAIGSVGGSFAHPLAQETVTCPGFMPSRLIVGEKGRVGPGGANNMRSAASKSGDGVGQIPGGAEFIVLEGPVCADGLAWWRVDYNGLTGWTAEGSGTDYWLEPAGPLPTQAATLTAIPATATPSEFACPGFLSSRLVVGERGRVVPGPANNLRAEPASGTQLLAEMPGGATFLVMEGPLCQAGLAWWKVDYYGTVGWTAEGSKDTYWVEPAGPIPTQAPTLTPTITPTPRPTYTPSPTSTPVPVFPPVTNITGREALMSANLPAQRALISTSSVPSIQPLAIFGRGGVQQIAVSPTGHNIAVVNSIGLWLNDITIPDQLGRFIETPNQVISAVTFSPDGHILATGGYGCGCPLEPTLQFWNVDTNQTLAAFNDFTYSVSALAFSPDGRWLGVAGMEDKSPKVWLVNVENGSWREVVEYDQYTSVNRVAFSPDSTLLATSSAGGAIRVWSLTANKQQISYEVQGTLGDVIFSPDGGYLIAAGGGGESATPGVLRIWNIATADRVNTPHFEQEFYQMSLSSDQKLLALLPERNPFEIWLWDMEKNQRAGSIRFPDNMARAKQIAFAPDGRLLVSHFDGAIRAWTMGASEGELLFDYDAGGGTLAISADGSLLAVASNNNRATVQLWNTITRELTGTFDQAVGFVNQMAFEPDGSELVFEIGRTLYRWNLETNEQATSSEVMKPVINPNQETLNKLARSFYSYTYVTIYSVLATPDGTMLVVNEGSKLTFWDIANRQPLASVRYFGLLTGFSADGTVMVTASDGATWLWGIPQ